MVGQTYARRLTKLGIETIEDLIFHFPFRYDDFSLISPIAKVQPGEIVTIKGQLISIVNEYTKNGKKIQKAIVADDSGQIQIIWFNQIYLVKTFKIGESYNFSGKIEFFGHQIVMISPEYENIQHTTLTVQANNKVPIHTGRLVPIYPETYGVSSKWLRSRIAPLLKDFLPTLIDYLPIDLLDQQQLIPLSQALIYIHFPENQNQIDLARKRLAFDELLMIQLKGLKRKNDWQKEKLSKPFSIDQSKISQFTESLPFELTNAQKRCVKEILADLTKSQPMNRLLQGDVGSGKTVVAAIAMYVAHLNGFQSAIMAPTEILANQHYQTLKQLLTPFGLTINLTTSSKKQYSNIAIKQSDIVVGTHALLYNKNIFNNLGLVIIDEQHRFGVEQRSQLVNKGQTPHVLTMTATPIPRTIALTLYGDLDLSVIDEMPIGRLKVKTWVVPPTKRQDAYNWIKKHVKDTDETAFVICPLIEESESLKTVKAVTVEFEKLKNQVFPDLRLGLLHGRMKSKEKDQTIEEFRKGDLDILVSTPVVEVGIDIPRATIMLIEAADRFGLAQLHQLRGRVGRGMKESYCLLFSDLTEGKAVQRLKMMETSHLGMELAEMDLRMRGPGEVYGITQHGFPDLKIASYSDLELIQETRQAAESLIGKLNQYPLLAEKLQRSSKPKVEPN